MWKAIRRCFSRTLTRSQTLALGKKGQRGSCGNLSAGAGTVEYDLLIIANFYHISLIFNTIFIIIIIVIPSQNHV